MNRRRSWHVQPTETPIASAVCSSDNPNSSGNSTACACRNWSAVFAVTTGVVGAALGKYVLDACRIADWRVRGFALGVAAHGIGTARAFQVNADAGAFAGLAFALHGLLAAILFPLGYWMLRGAS